MKDPTKQEIVIKCSLNQFVADLDVKKQIEKDVLAVSRASIEASIYIHHILYQKYSQDEFPEREYNFVHYFKHLVQQKTEKTINQYVIDPEYQALREQFGLPTKYDIEPNLIVYAANTYATAFKNNIWMHLYNRVNNFLRHVQLLILNKDFETNKAELNQQRNDTVKYVLGFRDHDAYNDELLQKMIEWTEWDAPLTITQHLYYRNMKVLFKIQRFNELFGLRNFSLVPILDHRRHHVNYCSQGLLQLLYKINLVADSSWTNFRPIKEATWHEYFYYRNLETWDKTFKFFFSTDGVAVSVHMLKPKIPEPQAESGGARKRRGKKQRSAAIEEMKEKLEKNKYEQRLGLDPGLKLMFGGVSVDKHGKEDNIKYRSRTYHTKSGFYHRKHVQNRLGRPIDWAFNRAAKRTSDRSAYHWSYTLFRLRFFERKQAVYEQRRMAVLRFKKYMAVQSTLTKVVKEFVAGKETLVVFGDSSISANSPMKGYIRTPNRRLLTTLRYYADVLVVNEHRTSKLCSLCYQTLQPPTKRRHRYMVCRNAECQTVWNRDVNAGRNILYKGICAIQEEDVHVNFNQDQTTKWYAASTRRYNKHLIE